MALRPITKESVNRFTCLVIGTAGIGKTSLIRTIPEGERALILSAESGLLCIADLVRSGQVEGFEIGNFSEMKEAYQFLLSPDGKKYQWVFIDSLSEISSRCVEAMQAKYPSKSDSFPMWGEYNFLVTQLVKGFRDLQTHSVVFSCLPSIDKDESNRRYIAPAVSGSSFKERLTSYFDEVFFMESRQTDDGTEYRCFLTQPIERYPAKDRSGKLAPIEKPDLSHIQNKILN
jgi:hypothetical protein